MRSPVLKDNPLLWRSRLMINELVSASHATLVDVRLSRRVR